MSMMLIVDNDGNIAHGELNGFSIVPFWESLLP